MCSKLCINHGHLTLLNYIIIRVCLDIERRYLDQFVQVIQTSSNNMEISFKNQRILVSGAGRGIGKDICIQLAKCGAQVVAISKTKANLDELKKQIPSLECVCVDLGDWNATRKALSQITEKPVHGLVNNAAVAVLEPFLTASPESFDLLMNINVKSVFNVTQAIAQDMIKRKISGTIVNISSQASMAGLTNHAIYCATKGALDAMTRAVAKELGPYNIRINCVNPTVIMTEMGQLGWSDQAKAKPMLEKIPLGRFGEVYEVTNAVLYMLSDKSSMIHGTTLAIDGGFLAC